MPRSRWTKQRLARLAFLAGRGCDPRETAADPLISSHGECVRRAAESVGIAFPHALAGSRQVRLEMPLTLYGKLEAQAQLRCQAPATLASTALSILADDSVLMDNVLDDC